MKFHDTVLGLAFFALALFIFAYALTIPPMPGQQYGADVFPRMIAVGLGGFGLVLAWNGWRAHKPGVPWLAIADWVRDRRTLGNFFLALAAIAVYVAFEDMIGFIPLSIGILFTLFVRQGVPALRSIVIAVAATIVIQIAFANLLRVPLPRGILTEILW
jgi:putative tricarboxylic transport membrane protein